MFVPFLDPDIRDDDLRRMVASIKSGWLAPGPRTAELEAKLAAYLAAPGAVMTGSCTAALHMALILAGVGPGDEVITTPLSWVATSNVILYQGANPVFADVERETGLLDPRCVERKLTARTKAVIVVHLYGQMADMRAYRALARKYKIAIIEDAAHALEAQRDGARPGERGFAACLSFHVAKNITSGQGGALILRRARDAARAKLLRRDGVRNTREGKRRMLELGYKYDATDYQAALLIGQMDRLDETTARRQAVFRRYREAFAHHLGIRMPQAPPDSVHAAHLFALWVDPERRDALRRHLSRRGIQTSIHYEPIHLEPYYRARFGFKDGDFPIAEALGAATVTLPTYSTLSLARQRHVIRSIREILGSG